MNKKLFPVVVLVSSFVFGGCSLTSKIGVGIRGDEDFKVAAELPGNANVPGQTNTEVDQQQLEQAQKVDSQSDDIDTIESDINSTVILNEDFSDL